jgi:hypothetical protein
MIELFAVPWPQVELEHIRAFLDTAGEEGVTWEAKADEDNLRERDRPKGEEPGQLGTHAIQKAVSGLANQIGGYLIVGARWDKGARRWRLPGVVVKDPEPELGLGKVIRNLNPVPRFEARAWSPDDDRTVAVVQVEPVAVPPCMTPLGHVYERVSGETLRVEDPVLLDRLFRRGEHARGRAEHFARRAARRALDAPSWKRERSIGIAIGLASVGRETDDISSRLFVKATREAIAASAWTFWSGGQPDDIEQRQEQDAYAVLGHFEDRRVLLPNGTPGPPMRTTWIVRGAWNGSAVASVALNPGAVEHMEPFDDLVRRGWSEIAALVERLGGYGPAHLAVVVFAAQPDQPAVVGQVARQPPPPPPAGSLYARLPEETTRMGRTVSVAAPDDDTIASLRRELNRAAGLSDDEPKPEPRREAGPAE